MTTGALVEYMLAIAVDETVPNPKPGEPGFAEWMDDWAAFTRRLMEGGHWIAGASLAPVATATTVRLSRDDRPAIVDGPFAETKEVFGGFYVVRAADLDEALELAAAIPLPAGSVEVRPLLMRPDADGTPRAVSR